MDLGIEGKWALVCAASKGLGKGCATALVKEGVNVVITARGADVLEATTVERCPGDGVGPRRVATVEVAALDVGSGAGSAVTVTRVAEVGH